MAGILTAAGEAKVALSIGGTAVAFAALRIGDGNGAPIVPNRLMTDLVRRVGGAYPVIASARDPENPTHWRVTTEIPAGEGPFTAREIAVFDAAGDMIAIASHPTVEFTGPGGDQLSIITDIVFPVSGAANIAVTISPSVLMPISRNLRPFWLTVESASVAAPPANPAVGASYVVPADATGAWAGQAGSIVQFTGEDWATVIVPIGHLVCVIDQALDAAGRYLRRTADAWVPAEATDLAFGFARRATAAEIVAGNGNGFVTPGQMVSAIDGLNDWDHIGGKPGEFPPSPHTHPQTEIDNLISDLMTLAAAIAAKVTKAGDRVTGSIRHANNVGSEYEDVGGFEGGTAGSAIIRAPDGNTYIDIYSGELKLRLAGYVPALVLTQAGNVGIGIAAPNHKVHSGGSVWAEDRLGVTAPGGGGWMRGGNADAADNANANLRFETWWGLGFGPTLAGQPVPLGENSHWFDARNGNMGLRGAIHAGGTDPGTPLHVMVGGTSTAWKSLADLFALGAVGSFGFFKRVGTTLVTNPGDVIAGSDLEWSGASHASGYFNDSNISPAGTWRCMGYVDHYVNATLYVRIA